MHCKFFFPVRTAGADAVRAAVVTCGGSCPLGCFPSSGTESSGTFSDGEGDYQNGENCWWLISTSPGTDISVRFESFDIEGPNYDEVRIYTCGESSCGSETQVGPTLSGQAIPNEEFRSSTGFLQIVFTSDISVVKSGFAGRWFLFGGAGSCDDCEAGKYSATADVIAKNAPGAEDNHSMRPDHHMCSQKLRKNNQMCLHSALPCLKHE